MTGTLVDSNIILDLVTDDPEWGAWSEEMLHKQDQTGPLFINPIIYSEVSIGFNRIEQMNEVINGCNLKWLEIPRPALFLAGKAFLAYRRKKGTKLSTLPDFFIGAHAVVSELYLLSRDTNRFKTYFPSINLISPEKG